MARAMLPDRPMLPWLQRWGRTLLCLAALAGVLIPLTAFAQTCPNVSITVNQTVPRFKPGGDTTANAYPFRGQNLNPTYINYQDCADDIVLQFTILVSGLPCSDTIQVWAGTTDCTQTAARQADSGQTHCWPVTAQGAFTTAASSTANIRAQDIVHYITNSEPPETYTPATKSACTSQASPGGIGDLSLYFMAIEADGLTVDGTSGIYAMGADLVGPYPPTNVVAGIGENIIVVSWTPATDSTIQGFNIYCEDQGAGAADASMDTLQEATLVCPDTGATATTTDAMDESTTTTTADAAGCHYVNLSSSGSGTSNCVSTELVNEFVTSSTGTTTEGGTTVAVEASTTDGESTSEEDVGISNIPAKYLCGQVGGNTTSSYVVTSFSDGGQEIMDGHQYAVTVAAFDGTGNNGIIGNLSCVVPAPVIDFWQAYTSAGGGGGGGFCALEGPGFPVSTSIFGIGTASIGIGLIRRRKRRR